MVIKLVKYDVMTLTLERKGFHLELCHQQEVLNVTIIKGVIRHHLGDSTQVSIKLLHILVKLWESLNLLEY